MDLDSTTQSVRDAVGVAGIVGASHDAFARVLLALRAIEDPRSDLFSAFVMASALAANGRDALRFASSLVSCDLEKPLGDAPNPGLAMESVPEMASLCQLLATRLDAAAETAVQAEDREACRESGRCAHEMAALLGGEP